MKYFYQRSAEKTSLADLDSSEYKEVYIDVIDFDSDLTPWLDSLISVLKPGDIVHCKRISDFGSNGETVIANLTRLAEKKVTVIAIDEDLKITVNQFGTTINLFKSAYAVKERNKSDRKLLNRKRLKNLGALSGKGLETAKEIAKRFHAGECNYSQLAKEYNKSERTIRRYTEKFKPYGAENSKLNKGNNHGE